MDFVIFYKEETDKRKMEAETARLFEGKYRVRCQLMNFLLLIGSYIVP